MAIKDKIAEFNSKRLTDIYIPVIRSLDKSTQAQNLRYIVI